MWKDSAGLQDLGSGKIIKLTCRISRGIPAAPLETWLAGLYIHLLASVMAESGGYWPSPVAAFSPQAGTNLGSHLHLPPCAK